MGLPESSRHGAVLGIGLVAHARDGLIAGLSDAPALASGDNEQMDMRQLAVGAALGLVSLAELVARLSAGSTVRPGLAAGPLTHTGVRPSTALLMCAFCLLATVPAALLRPVSAAMAIGVGAVLSLILFELVTVAGAAALVLVAYRLARSGSMVLALALAVPFLGLALGEAASGTTAATLSSGLAAASVETQALAVVLASAIPVASLAATARRAREESRSHGAARALTAGVLAEHLARGERARIARELHDVVAHHISMIAVQAESARLTTPGLTDAGAQGFVAIGDTARAGLTEMRRLLGVLREDAQAAADVQAITDEDSTQMRRADRRPQPGLPQLAELVDEAREASGGTMRLIVSGQVTRRDPGVELAAYRIVQEALTNARRHAPGAAVDVELRYANDVLWLQIRDNGPGSTQGDATNERDAGHGLLGMRERAAAAGGSLWAGNSPGGGFCVEAELPVKAPDGLSGAA
jgi:signal transduction histidine kinase